jgi:hypothetical protein
MECSKQPPKTQLTIRQEPSIDAILRGLTDRPNVESTLILSRKDGSIIKTSGFASSEKRRRAQSSAPFQPPENGLQSKDEGAAGEEADSEQRKSLPQEELAASIFHFMKAAGTLGSTLTSVADEQAQEDGSQLRKSDANNVAPDAGDTTEEGETRRNDSQVQLLRLRVRHREIIIFPDPQYLCCVVQRVGKQHSGAPR